MSLQEHEIIEKLNLCIRNAQRAPHYSKLNLINSLEEFSSLPLLKGAKFSEESNIDIAQFLANTTTDCWLFASGGTTGDPKLIVRSNAEINRNIDRIIKGLKLQGITSDDITINILAGGGIWAGMVMYNKAIEKIGGFLIPLGERFDFYFLFKLIARFKVSTIIALPSQLITIANYARDNNIKIKLNKVITGGENLFSSTQKYLQKHLGVSQFISAGYGANDIGSIGYQCSYCDSNQFHIHEDAIYLEIIDKQGNLSQDMQYGELIVTALDRKLMPMIRYQIGDEGRVISRKPCKCGHGDLKIELKGRSGNSIKLAGSEIITLESLIELTDLIKGLTPILQIILSYADNGLTQVNIKIEALSSVESCNFLSLADTYLVKLGQLQPIQEVLYLKLINLLEVEIVPSNSLERNSRTGKISYVIDKRQ